VEVAVRILDARPTVFVRIADWIIASIRVKIPALRVMYVLVRECFVAGQEEVEGSFVVAGAEEIEVGLVVALLAGEFVGHEGRVAGTGFAEGIGSGRHAGDGKTAK
jgi:hypothetical protein